MAELGRWGAHHRPTTPTPRVRAELLAGGGPAVWEDFMTGLRGEHVGIHVPPDLDQLRPSALPRPAAQHSLPTQTIDLASDESPQGRRRRAVPAALQEETSPGILQMRGHARSGGSRIPRPVKIPAGCPIRDTVSTCISPAQNVLFWFSIGHFGYDKIADQIGGYFAGLGDPRPGH